MGDDTPEVSRQDRVQAAGPSPEAWVTLLPEARNDTATTKSASSHCLRQLPAAGRLGFAPAQPRHNAICAPTVGKPGDRSKVMAVVRAGPPRNTGRSAAEVESWITCRRTKV